MKHNSVLEDGFIGALGGARSGGGSSDGGDFSRARRSRVKRAMDIGLSLTLLVLISPLLIVIALLIKLSDGGSIFFSQMRVGVNGEYFRCFKFRTMVADAEAQLSALIESDPVAAEEWRLYKKVKNDPRITWLGRFLRKSSLDELPQIINILNGDMSIIGPRPITEREIVDYGTPADMKIYGSVRPGVLGLWQISGRSDTSFDKRVELDVEYAREWSISKDIGIMLASVPAILFGKGAY